FVAEGFSQCHELTEGIPTEVVFLNDLLDVLRGGATGTGLEESAASHQWNNGEHLCRGAQFQDGEEVGVVVTQDVTGDGDGVLATTDTVHSVLGCLNRGEDLDVQT